MLSDNAIKTLENQHYKVVGTHSAVKICGWTKKMIKGEGGCYKLKFYGIKSNQCLQMTTSMSCANRCIFCWRDYKAPVAKEWEWNTDEPELILKQSKEAQKKLLSGFGGCEYAQEKELQESKTIKHCALSLSGEPIIYPKLNEFIDLLHKDNISTFLVTNAQHPEQIKNLKPITQLYISLDGPTKEILKEIDNPLFKDYWERLNQSLEYFSQKKQRTCIRLTLIKEMNMSHLKEYSELIKKGNPDFIELKGYMFVGSSRQRLSMKNMPYHEDTVNFTNAMLKYLPDYDIVSEHISSRVILLAKKKYKKEGKWHTWIDFEKFNTLINSGKDFSTEEFLAETPETGLSGKGTKENIKIDEKTDELEFWQEN